MHERRRSRMPPNSHWITPGGGVEPGETPAEAAVREVYEETGLRIALPPDAEPMYTERVRFTFAGQDYRPDQPLLPGPGARPVCRCEPAAHTEVEQSWCSAIAGGRWPSWPPPRWCANR